MSTIEATIDGWELPPDTTKRLKEWFSSGQGGWVLQDPPNELWYSLNEHNLKEAGLISQKQRMEVLQKLKAQSGAQVPNTCARTGFATHTPPTPPAFNNVNAEDISPEAAWKAEIVNRNVSCVAARTEDVLEGRSLREDFRYLQLLLGSIHLEPEIAALIQSRLLRKGEELTSRAEDAHAPSHVEDLELPYHPIVLALFQAASKGQEGLMFLLENQASDDRAREDIRGMVRVKGKMRRKHASEVKPVYFSSPPGDTMRGLYRNRAGLGKVLKSVKVHGLHESESPTTTLGALISRCEFVWFMELDWELEADGEWRVKRVRVAPEFPESSVQPRGQLVSRTDWEHIEEELSMHRGQITFRDFILWANEGSTSAPEGFRLLSRYADTLASMESLPITPLRLIPRAVDSSSISLDQARILAQGLRSIILRVEPGASYVVKVGSSSSIMLDYRIHEVIDPVGCQHLRAAVPGLLGAVAGTGDGLSFIGLEHFCDFSILGADMSSIYTRTKYMEQATQALSALHGAKVLHRDVKPDNLLLRQGSLLVNDFDVSCLASDNQACKDTRVGAEVFRAPRLDTNGQSLYEFRDDWASLGLSFAFLFGLYNGKPALKLGALKHMCRLQYVPDAFKMELLTVLHS